MNKLLIIGNCCKDPELRTTQSGKNVTSFSVAVNYKAGSEKKTDFISVTAWEKKAELCAQYLKKGQKVFISGRPYVHSYNKNNGDTVTELAVNCDEIEFLAAKEEKSAEQYEPYDGALPWEH